MLALCNFMDVEEIEACDEGSAVPVPLSSSLPTPPSTAAEIAGTLSSMDAWTLLMSPLPAHIY